MDKPWIGDTLVRMGTEGRRWLAKTSQEPDSNNLIRNGPAQDVLFSVENGAFVMHMRAKLRLSLQIHDSKGWLGDGQTKIKAVFTGASITGDRNHFDIHDFDIVINPTNKPDSRVTLRIGDFNMHRVIFLSALCGDEAVENIPEVQKLLKTLEKPLKNWGRQSPAHGSETMSSPMRSQTGADEDFATQAAFSTQLPTLNNEHDVAIVPRRLPSIDRSMRNGIKNDPQPNAIEEGLRNIDYLMRLAGPLPRKAAVPHTATAQKFPAINPHTENELAKYSNQGDASVPYVSNSQMAPESPWSDGTKAEKLVTGDQVSSSPSHPVRDRNHELQNAGGSGSNSGLEDAELLGDSEKENSHQNFVANPSTNSKTGLLQINHEQVIDVSNLEDDVHKGMKKIPSRWLKIPRDQKKIIDRAEAWVTPSIHDRALLPDSVLQELRAKPVEQVAEQRIKESINSISPEVDDDSTDLDSHEDEAVLESKYDPPFGIESNELPMQKAQRSHALPRNEDIPPSTREQSLASSQLSSMTSDEVVSWSASPDEDQQANEDPHSGYLDEAVSVVLESSIPESSLAMRINLASVEKDETPKFVQVIASNPAKEEEEEEEEEEEMEMAEPSALGHGTTSAEDCNQSRETVPSQQDTSTASQEQVVVEVERTPRFRMFRSQFDSHALGFPGQVNSSSTDYSSGFVVPGTVEDSLHEVSNTFPVTRPLENLDEEPFVQSSKPERQVRTNMQKNRSSTSPMQDSSVVASTFHALQHNQSSSIEGSSLQQQEESIAESQNSQSDQLPAAPRQTERVKDSMSQSRKVRTPQLQHHQAGKKKLPQQGQINQTDMGHEYSLPQAMDAAEVNAIHQSSSRIRSLKPFAMEEGHETRAASGKRTSSQAGLNMSSPPAKRKTYSAKFTPGTQSPVDLDELKRLNRQDFLRGNRIAEQSVTSPDHLSSGKSVHHQVDASGKDKNVAAGPSSTTNTGPIEPVVASHSNEEGDEDIQNSDSHMASHQFSRHGMASEKHANIYERYQQAYPTFTKSLHAFTRACVCIDWLTPQHLMPMLWDDFVHKFCYEYEDYVVKCSKPITAIKWYNEHDNFTCQKRVLNKDNLKEALALDPAETEKLQKRFRNGASTISASRPTAVESRRQPSLSPNVQDSPPPRQTSPDDVEFLGVKPRPSTGKRSLPWASTPQSNIRDEPTPHNKRRKVNDQEDSGCESSVKLSSAGLKNKPSKGKLNEEAHVRQASPKLDSQHVDMPTTRPELDRSRKEHTFSPTSRSNPPIFQSPAPGPIKQSRARATESGGQSVSDKGSRRSSVSNKGSRTSSVSGKGSKPLSLNVGDIAEQTRRFEIHPLRRWTHINTEEADE